MHKEWVLVTSDGPQLRDALVAIRALAEAGYHPAIAVSCGFSLAGSSRYCLRRVDVPSPEDPAYVPAIRSELSRLPYLTVLPASEVALLALGVSVPALVDKAKVEELAEAVGIPSPPGRLFPSKETLLAAADELDYPVILKPAIHRYHASRVESPAGLAAAVLQDVPVMVQPYLNHALHAVSGILWRGQMVAAVHERWFRIWRFHCGVATAAETVEPDVELEERLTRLLVGYEGYFHAQFAGPYLLDLNLRVHTSHPLAVAAGVNLVGLYCDLLRGEEIPTVRGRPGRFFRWIEGDVRHVARAIRTGSMGPREALAALRPRRGTAHSTESIRDPGPMLSRLWYLGRTAASRALGRAGVTLTLRPAP
jgi:hypothetical protein